MESFTGDLESLVRDGQGEYALGEERYTTLLRKKELLGYGAAELRRGARRHGRRSTSRCRASPGRSTRRRTAGDR